MYTKLQPGRIQGIGNHQQNNKAELELKTWQKEKQWIDQSLC